MLCSICNSNHCPETNMDNTIGCCLCYNKQMIKENNEIISLCEKCKKHKVMHLTDYIYSWMKKHKIPRTRESELTLARVLDSIIFKVKKKIGSKHL